MTRKEEICLRSYLIWEKEGCPHGVALRHWLRAEAQIDAEREAAYQIILVL